MAPVSRKTVLFALATVVWLAGAGAGLRVLWAYDNQPGVAAAPPPTWPADGAVALASDTPTLVVLAHPQCFCTQATLTELAEVLGRTRIRPRTYILFMKPEGVPEGWTDTRLWRQAAALPDVRVIRDDDGITAREFGAETSGQVVLYDAKGTLVFSGGITPSRGHAGDNAGRAAIISLLNEKPAGRRTTSVFGCPLFASASEA